MPIMPRVPGKATKIAYAVNGVPENIAAKKSARQRYIDSRMLYVNTYRMK